MRKEALLLLNNLGFSTKKLGIFLQALGAPERIFSLSEGDLPAFGLTQSDIRRVLSLRDSGFLKNELRRAKEEGIDIIVEGEDDYPALLREAAGHPLALYVKGDKSALSLLSFAIVGTRLPSVYGINMSRHYSLMLSALGFVIVSGLARGVDTVAHKAALESGKTVAVLGSGLCNIYPRENAELAQRICRNGAVVSEFPLDAAPLKENFPRRNRIISGLSKGVLVVEAAARSGALITAHYALEQDREVFALPGNIDSELSKGTHSLIKEGAKLVDSIEDITQELNMVCAAKPLSRAGSELNAQEKDILGLLSGDGVYFEELLARSNFEQASVSKIVLGLQLKGLIKEVRPSCFVKTVD